MTDAKVPFRILLPITAALAALIFLPTAGLGIAQSGLNPDEWRFAAGRANGFAEIHGRWATHWAHEVFVGKTAPIALLIAIIFVALFGISVLIARRSTRPAGPAMTITAILAVFLAGFSHVYLTEILHYQTLAPWFSLGLFTSLAAMALIEPVKAGSVPRMILRLIVAAELLSISMGFYQSYALLGLLVPATVLIRVDRFDHRQSLFCLLQVTVVSVAALILYRLQLSATLTLLDLDANFRFSARMDMATVFDKLSTLPRLERSIHNGGLLGLHQPYRGLFLLSTAAACGVVLLAALTACLAPHALRGGGWLGAFRVLLGGLGAFFILPVLIWFLYPEPYFIARSIGFMGFVFAGVVLASTTVIVQGMDSRAVSRLMPVGGLALVLVFGVTQAFTSSRLWPLFQRVAEQDVALADAIVTRADPLEGFDVRSVPIRSVGAPSYSKLSFGDFHTPSTFHRGIDINSIFQVRYGAADYASSALATPRTCPAFPAEGSVFMADGTLFVCLEASAPLPARSTCFPLNAGKGGAVCYADGMAVLVGRTCTDIDPGKGQIVATQLNQAGHRVRSNRFNWQARETWMNGLCHRFVANTDRPFSTLRIEHKIAAPGQTWAVERNASDARTLEEIFETGNKRE
ncbi:MULTISPECIES: glucosyltransferase domain-containing protein [unclassified Ruegeria]|uniref:glucosyltransferase domain-containing protein n=1 Tax=unclassified Ruegeria TaxID=2625375 RepID=UPI001AE19564|nr:MULTISPECIES: glucosyltransferase domain-containing protein [unclassified Ruegeria]